MHNFKDHNSLMRWIYVTARNAAIDYKKLNKRRLKILESIRAYTITFNEGIALSPEGKNDRSKVKYLKVIKKALSKLSKAESECINLHYFDGLTQKEIAQKLGKDIGQLLEL